ncbi:MAG: GNAT family N-acetyltransferase [Acidobacteria bacterium]|nr:GNAT family N-acetyltransferase [Acidobacteriota bacterium]
MSDIAIRPLSTYEEYKQVLELERLVWGFSDPFDMVPPVVFTITVKRGAILLGAFDGDRMVGFSYSLVGMKDKERQVLQWSHMTGVLPAYRGGLGLRLKLAQRDRALELGYDLIEWTFDPLQAMNAHLNVAKLGCVAEEYHRNVYGESTSALHRGTPTDRLVAQWHIAEPHVVRRLATPVALRARASEVTDAPLANRVATVDGWRVCEDMDLSIDTRRFWIEIPTGWTDLQREVPEVATTWRMQTREAFESYFARGYRVVDFVLARDGGFGRYLLARKDDA